MIQRYFVKVDDVPEIPAHDATAVLHTGEGDMQCVGGPFCRDHASPQVGVAQAHGLDGDGDELSPRQVFLIGAC